MTVQLGDFPLKEEANSEMNSLQRRVSEAISTSGIFHEDSVVFAFPALTRSKLQFIFVNSFFSRRFHSIVRSFFYVTNLRPACWTIKSNFDSFFFLFLFYF